MGVKPDLAFDVCWEVYRGARDVLEAKRGMSAMDWKEATKYLWRPDFRPRLGECVVDSALAGQAALEGPEWASRMVLFRLYYLGMAPYENARHFLGLSEQGWVNWSEEVRRRVGKERCAGGCSRHENILAMRRNMLILWSEGWLCGLLLGSPSASWPPEGGRCRLTLATKRDKPPQSRGCRSMSLAASPKLSHHGATFRQQCRIAKSMRSLTRSRQELRRERRESK